MYVLLDKEKIKKYPYSVSELRSDNPQVSFPNSPSSECLAAWNVFTVKQTEYPEVDYTKNVEESLPVLNDGVWTQVWKVVDATPEEISERQKQLREQIKYQRLDAYRNESDPLFFKAQRGEATMEEWLAKVAEIKAKYPEEL